MIGELRDRWRFKGGAQVGVHREQRLRAPREAKHGTQRAERAVAGVVGIRGRDQLVPYREADAIIAERRTREEAMWCFQLRTHIPAKAAHPLLLVKARRAALIPGAWAERGCRRGGNQRRTVFKIEAVIHLVLHIHTAAKPNRPRPWSKPPCAVQRPPGHLPINGNHGKGQWIVERPGAEEKRPVHGVLPTATRRQQGHVRLLNRLARSTDQVQRIRQSGIARQLGRRERPSVLGARRVIARALHFQSRPPNGGECPGEGAGGIQLRPLAHSGTGGPRNRAEPTTTLHEPAGITATPGHDHRATLQPSAIPQSGIHGKRTL